MKPYIIALAPALLYVVLWFAVIAVCILAATAGHTVKQGKITTRKIRRYFAHRNRPE